MSKQDGRRARAVEQESYDGVKEEDNGGFTCWWQILGFIAGQTVWLEERDAELAVRDALRDLHAALKRALLASDRYSRALKESASADREFFERCEDDPDDPFASTYIRLCEDKLRFAERLAQPELKAWAGNILRSITRAINPGDDGDIRHLRHLANAVVNNRVTRWFEICSRHRERATHVDDPNGDWLRTKWIPALPKLLAAVEPLAANLTPEQVSAAWLAEKKPDKFASRLARECGAFGDARKVEDNIRQRRRNARLS